MPPGVACNHHWCKSSRVKWVPGCCVQEKAGSGWKKGAGWCHRLCFGALYFIPSSRVCLTPFTVLTLEMSCASSPPNFGFDHKTCFGQWNEAEVTGVRSEPGSRDALFCQC